MSRIVCGNKSTKMATQTTLLRAKIVDTLIELQYCTMITTTAFFLVNPLDSDRNNEVKPFGMKWV